MSLNLLFLDAKVETGCSVIPSQQIMIESKNTSRQNESLQLRHRDFQGGKKPRLTLPANRRESKEQASLSCQ